MAIFESIKIPSCAIFFVIIFCIGFIITVSIGAVCLSEQNYIICGGTQASAIAFIIIGIFLLILTLWCLHFNKTSNSNTSIADQK